MFLINFVFPIEYKTVFKILFETYNIGYNSIIFVERIEELNESPAINSVTTSIKRRVFFWSEAANLIDFEKLEKSIKIISLENLMDIYPKMLKGETSGRYIIDLNK